MKVEELRIGNLVYCKTENGLKVGKISSLTDFGFIEAVIDSVKYGGRVEYEVIEPIPITEDILLNCGFEKETNGDYITIYTKIGCISIVCQKKCYYPYDYDYGVFIGKELKFVHELQNAVFVLTGEVLEIELK